MTKDLHGFIYKGFTKYFLSVFFTFLCSSLFGQVKFFASSNSNTIGKGQYLQVQFTIENASNVETIIPPSFKNFTIISGPNQQSSMSNINGNIKHTISIGFVLQPTATGVFIIGSATAKADGKEYRSNSLRIQVTTYKSSRSPNSSPLSPFGNITLDRAAEPVSQQFDDYILRKGENVPEKIKRNLFLSIDVSKKSCFVGEPIIATYKLFTRLKSESNVLKAPSFNGFSVSELEMPDNYALSTEKYKGRDYNVYILRKVQLYPLQSGNLGLEPVEVKNKITFLKAEYASRRSGDFFYDMLRDFANENSPGEATDQQIITITGDTVNINVKPLPEANKPPHFKGAVGKYKIAATLEKQNITTDDAGALKVILSGEGNIQLVNAPNVVWPDNVERFESKSSENIDKFSVPLKGDKIFIYPFTVTRPGNYTIPPIQFAYFDISTQSYKTISTRPFSVHVKKGTGNPHKTFKSESNDQQTNNWYNSIDRNLIYFIGTLILFCVLTILFVKNKNSKKQAVISGEHIRKDIGVKAPKSFGNYQSDPVEEEAFIIPANPLAEAEQKFSEGDIAQFYKVLDISFHNYLSEKLNVPVEELTKKKINERMDKYNVGVGTTLLVNSVLEDIELNLYAPAYSETKMQEVYEKAREAVSLIDKQIS